jgi:hypothetical protein
MEEQRLLKTKKGFSQGPAVTAGLVVPEIPSRGTAAGAPGLM